MADRLKQALRKTCQQIRSTLSAQYKIKVAEKINQQIQQLPQYRQAKNLAFYHAFRGEVDLEAVWHLALRQEKHCYFPTLTPEGRLSFLPADLKTPIHKNRYGILEPTVNPGKALPLSQMDIMFLPLLAFDDKGTRLGMGVGYYDKTLAHTPRPFLIGIAYEFQHCSFIAAQAWDVKMNMIITEKGTHWVK